MLGGGKNGCRNSIVCRPSLAGVELAPKRQASRCMCMECKFRVVEKAVHRLDADAPKAVRPGRRGAASVGEPYHQRGKVIRVPVQPRSIPVVRVVEANASADAGKLKYFFAQTGRRP